MTFELWTDNNSPKLIPTNLLLTATMLHFSGITNTTIFVARIWRNSK